MATSRSHKGIFSLAGAGNLQLKPEAGRIPDYVGLVVHEDTLMVVDFNAKNLQLYSRRDGKLLSTSRELESGPMCVCLINKTEIALCLSICKIVIMSFKSLNDIKLAKILDVRTEFHSCHSVAKVISKNEIVVSGWEHGDILNWCVVSLADGHVNSNHKICKGGNWSSSHLAIKDNIVYISCWTDDSTVDGVYAFDIFRPQKQKFLYQHHELMTPWIITIDRWNFIYVCDRNLNIIQQLTDGGQLVTIHKVSPRPYAIFYDDQHGVLYTTGWRSNLVNGYKLDCLHQPDLVTPEKVQKVDSSSLQMYKVDPNDGKEKVYNIRVMVVGKSGVGKTTLTQNLLGKNVNISERHSTDGIELHVDCCKVSLAIGDWKTQEKNENSGKSIVEHASLAFWDFSGENVFYTTHQTFLTSRAIYLLVIDLSQQVSYLIKDDECFLDTEGMTLRKVHDLIEFWLNSIHSCEPSSHPGIPPVILVGTHVDKIPEKFRKKVIDNYFMKIRQMLKNKPSVYHLVDNIAIDNTQCDHRLQDLKRRIYELASRQRHWREEKPARWLPLEKAIMTLKASGFKVALTEDIIRSGFFKNEDRNELEVFLSFQHEIGTILYFSADGLREKIVLDPQWMIDAIKSLIMAETFVMQHPTLTQNWYDFKEKGKLTHQLIDAIWAKEEKPDFHDNKDHILRMMEKMNIIIRPVSYTDDGTEYKVENYFLAPCMLRETTPEDVFSLKPLSEMDSSSVLCFVFVEQFLPYPIFHRLLAACVVKWPVAEKNSENLIYCGCCVFHLDLHHRLTMFFRGHVIFLRVTRMGTTGKLPSSQLCTEVKDFISRALSKINENLEQSLRFELHIQCPRSDGCSVNSLIPVADLQGNVDVPCHSHDESHVIMSCDLLKFWFQEEGQTVIEGIGGGKDSKISLKGEVVSMDRVPSTPIKKGNRDIQDQILSQAHYVRANAKSFPSELYQSIGDKTLDVMERDERIDHITPETSTQMEQADVPTVVEGKSAGTKSKESEKGDVTSRKIDHISDASIIKILDKFDNERDPEKLHRTVLNRCWPELMKDLHVRAVMMHIQRKELFDDVTMLDIWDIMDKKPSSHAISKLIQLIQQRDQDTYDQFKECLVQARQVELKVMLEEEEEKLAREIKGKHRGTDLSTSEEKRREQTTVVTTSMAETTHSSKAQTSGTKTSTTSASTTKAVATAAPTTVELTTQSPSIQTSRTKASATTESVTKALATAAPKTTVQSTRSTNLQATDNKSSTAAASTAISHATAAPSSEDSASKVKQSKACYLM